METAMQTQIQGNEISVKAAVRAMYFYCSVIYITGALTALVLQDGYDKLFAASSVDAVMVVEGVNVDTDRDTPIDRMSAVNPVDIVVIGGDANPDALISEYSQYFYDEISAEELERRSGLSIEDLETFLQENHLLTRIQIP